MDQGSDDIRQDIESTRSSLDAKLSLLENKATEATENVKQAFDIKSQVAERPWTAVGVAIAAGYVLGSLGGGDDTPYASSSYTPSSSSNVSYPSTGPSSNQNAGPSATDKLKEKGADFLSQFDDEIDVIKGAAISTLTGLLRDTVKQYVPMMSQHLDDALRQRGLPLTSASGGNGGSAAGQSAASGGYGAPSSYTPSPSSGGSSGGRQVSSAPTASMSAAAEMPNADYDNIGQMNRVGMPPANNQSSEYYETYTPGTSSDQPEPPSINPGDNDKQSERDVMKYTQ